MTNRTILAAFTAASIISFHPASMLRAAEHAGHDHAESWASIKQAVAVLHSASGSKTHGRIQFVQQGDAVKITADLEGLTPGQKHAMHIHEFGDCTAPDATSAGSHYNPEGHPHGLPEAATRHAGDLGNVQADSNGKAHYELTVRNLTIAGTKNPVIGRAVIVHAKPDDGGQPVGNAGGRIACGVIGVAKAAGPAK
jgi:Cu-Zn family superoxide dismutase